MARYTKKQLAFRLILIFCIGFLSAILTTPMLVYLTGNITVDKPLIIAVIQGAICSGILALVNAIKNYVNGEEIDYNTIEKQIKESLQNNNQTIENLKLEKTIKEDFKEIKENYEELEENKENEILIDEDSLSKTDLEEINNYFNTKGSDEK